MPHAGPHVLNRSIPTFIQRVSQFILGCYELHRGDLRLGQALGECRASGVGFVRAHKLPERDQGM